MNRIDKTIDGWQDYCLIDSGQGRKLEKFSNVILDRPDPQAIWNKSFPETWSTSNAQFLWADKGERWKTEKDIPESWQIKWNEMKLTLSMKGFKHIGIFPEHSFQWQEIYDLGLQNKNLRLLNLFGYTGAASIVGALSGMSVTHVDASRSTIEKVKENAILSQAKLENMKIICEDALRFVKRLINRKESYDVIILDPPAFGRGPKGEVWKIEDSILELIYLLPNILSKNAKMVILNGYSSGYSALTFAEMLNIILSKEQITYGDIGINQINSDRVLTTGIYAKWENI